MQHRSTSTSPTNRNVCESPIPIVLEKTVLNLSQLPMVPNTTPTGTSWTAGARMWTLPSTRSPSVFLPMDGRTGSSRSQTQRTVAERRTRTALSCLPKVLRARTRTSLSVWRSRTGARLTMPSSRVRKGKVIGLFSRADCGQRTRGTLRYIVVSWTRVSLSQ